MSPLPVLGAHTTEEQKITPRTTATHPLHPTPSIPPMPNCSTSVVFLVLCNKSIIKAEF